MPGPGVPKLSLSEWLVLCLIREKPTHGFAIATLLGSGGPLGQVWRVPKPVIYRAIQRLERLGLVQSAGEEHTGQGPVRSLTQVTAAGRRAAADWLRRPVAHARDVRSELLVKLALLDRAGADPQTLLLAQRAQLAPIVTALDDRLKSAEGFEHTLALWRHETMAATMRFLAAIGPPG
jgi:DNA-binding PadR family transcriptional regulator